MTSLPLPIRKNIRDAEPKRDVHLVTLKTGSGLDFTVEPPTWDPIVAGVEQRNKESVGTLVYDQILSHVVNMLNNNLKDDMVKEEFLNKATAKKITFKFDSNIQMDSWRKNGSSNHVFGFENGVFVVSFGVYLNTNLDRIDEYKLENLL